jgi:hypothetical protein
LETAVLPLNYAPLWRGKNCFSATQVSLVLCGVCMVDFGEGGIRTLETVSGLTV